MRETLRRTRRVAWRTGLFKLGGAPWRPAALTVAAVLAGSGAAWAQVPPDEAWRTLSTEHFRVTFPAHLEDLGRRAADRAERAYDELSSAFIAPPDGPIDLLVTDHTDFSNGFAQFFPSNRITVFARPPADDLTLGHFDDWMELVITHELAHIVHLDHTATWVGELSRSVFGRVNAPWPFFPAWGTPRWVIEGLATWYESDLTRAGRVRGTFFDMVLRTAALEGRFESLGQASGDSPVWPGGNRWYAYGSLFFRHLLEKHGEESMVAFVEAVAGQWVPYRLDAAGKAAFGATLSEEWEAWATEARAAVEDLDARLAVHGPVTEPERLTRGARWGLDPVVSPSGDALVHVRSDAKSDQQLVIAAPDGTAPRQLTRTNQLATFDFLPDGRVVFAQLELADPYRIHSDLYVVDRSGRVRRATEGARLSQPSAGPSGDWVVAVSEGEATTGLTRVELATGAVTPIADGRGDVHWAFPAVSPDGRWIAATRWGVGGDHDVVVLDPSGRMVSEVTADRALDTAPDWSPDGRWLVWASDRSGTFNILAAPVDPGTGAVGEPVMLTNVRTGAAYPSVDPSGRWLYFSGYHVDGWEVERVRFDPSAAPAAPPAVARYAAAGPPPARTRSEGEVEGYSPWPTLLPTYWEPTLREPVETPPFRLGNVFVPRREVLGFAVGAQTGGVDLVGRHAWAALGRVFTTGGRAEGAFTYSYAGLGNPVLGVSASQGWNQDGTLLGQRDPDDPIDVLHVLERQRSVSGSLTLQRPTWRRTLGLTVSGGLVWERHELLDATLELSERYRLTRPSSRLGDLSVSVNVSTARTHSFQMGGARGASLFLRARTRNELSLPDSLAGVVNVDRSADDLIGVARAYLPVAGPGYASHVLAFRGSFGAARGPNATAGFYDVGGAAGSAEDVTGLSLFGGSPIFFPVRGYAPSSRFGRYAWSLSAEYRVPLLLLNRGLGAWPLHFDRVIGAVFADAGNAWGPDVSATGFQNPRRDGIASVGAEITAEVLSLFRVSTRVRTGVAFPLVDESGPQLYVRVGLPF